MNACLGLANRFSDSRAFSVFNEFSQKVKGEVRGFVYFPRPQWQRQFYPSTASVTTTSSCNDSDNDDSILRRPWRFHPSMAVAISSLNDSGNGARFYPLVATTFDFIPQRQVIAHLLKPRGWKPSVRRQFFLDCNEIADLCDSAVRIFSSEPSVLQIKAPAKIFGDLHGQFGDLMRLFDEYGSCILTCIPILATSYDLMRFLLLWSCFWRMG